MKTQKINMFLYLSILLGESMLPTVKALIALIAVVLPSATQNILLQSWLTFKKKKKSQSWGTWMAQFVECTTLDLGIMCSNPMLTVEIA